LPKQALTQNTHFYNIAIAQKFIYSVVQESFNAVIVTTKCSYNRNMKFEWDESKRLFNIRKHKIDFSDVPVVFNGLIVTVEDERFDYGEQRFVTFGLLQG
jgi:Ribonuclease toxin, BrnT, of type II toxin-antitoxin system